jgi:hypothetical protein
MMPKPRSYTRGYWHCAKIFKLYRTACFQNVEQTIQQVFGKIEKRRQYRSLKWAGAAVAAGVIAAVSSVIPGRQVLQMANVSNQAIRTEEKLLVALNTP